MKKFLLILFVLPAVLNAQEDSTRKVKVVSISAWAGGTIVRGGFEDRTVFQQAVPSSSLAFADITGYNNEDGMYLFSNTTASASRGIMVNLKVKGCKSSEFRAGLEHGTTVLSSQFYSKATSTTLYTTPLPGGGILSSDSVHNSQYSYDWTSDMLALNLSWTVRSNPGRIISFYTGAGIYGGMGFNGKIENVFLESSRTEHTSSSPSYVYYTTDYETKTLVTENFAGPGFGYFGAYVPIGFNIRLGRRNAILSHLAYFGEYQGSIQFIKAGGVDIRIRTSSSFNSGLKWYIVAPKAHWKKEKNRDGRKNQRHHE